MFGRILFACDFSPAAEMAFHVGLNLAKECESEVCVVNVITNMEAKHYFAAEGMGVDHLRRFQELKMEGLLASEPGAVTDWEVLVGESVSVEIARYARRRNCGLIVTGVHGRSLLGSTAEEIAGTSEVPVMMIREPVYSETQHLQFDRILVPVDFCESSLKALSFAFRFANFMGSELHLVHVVDRTGRRHPEQQYAWLDPDLSKEDIATGILFGLEREVQRVLEQQKGKVSIKRAALFGRPVNEVLRYAEQEKCGLIVAGAYGEEPAAMPILGSISRGFLEHSHIPIITVCSPPAGEIPLQEDRAAAASSVS